MNGKNKDMDRLLREWGVDDSYFVLTPERLEQIHNKKCKEDEEIKNFIKDNPFPSIDEMDKLKKLMVLDKYPENALNDFYYRRIVEKMYNNLTDEETVVECCRELFNMKFSKAQMKFSFILCNTNLYILSFILRYRYNTRKSNKKYNKELILGRNEIINKWCNMHIEGWDDYLIYREKQNK